MRDLLSLDILTAFELFLGAVDRAHEYALEEELVLFADSDQHDAGGVGSKRLPVASRDELRQEVVILGGLGALSQEILAHHD